MTSLRSVLGLGLDAWVDPLDAPPTVRLVRPEVAAVWCEWSAQFEGRCSHMYLDVRGLVTTGVGNLIDPMPLALALPWRFANGATAGHDDIVAEWLRVKAMPPAMLAGRYASPVGLHLSDAAIEALVSEQLVRLAAGLAHHYPEFADYPAPAQQAILSMGWAMGSGFPSSWPRFSSAVRARDWARAAEECAISTRGNAGVAPRNIANRALLLAAAEVGA